MPFFPGPFAQGHRSLLAWSSNEYFIQNEKKGPQTECETVWQSMVRLPTWRFFSIQRAEDLTRTGCEMYGDWRLVSRPTVSGRRWQTKLALPSPSVGQAVRHSTRGRNLSWKLAGALNSKQGALTFA